MKLFVNQDIYQSDGDYVIGGFYTDKTENFNFTDFKDNVKERIENLLQVYLSEADAYNAELGFDEPTEKSKLDAANVILDNLGIEVEYLQENQLVNAIMKSPQMQYWMDGIRTRIKEFPEFLNASYVGVFNESSKIGENSYTYQNAKQFTDESTFQQLIEQLSIIEL